MFSGGLAQKLEFFCWFYVLFIRIPKIGTNHPFGPTLPQAVVPSAVSAFCALKLCQVPEGVRARKTWGTLLKAVVGSLE